MKLLAITGSGRYSGKTTTVESVVKGLSTRGFMVGTIKQIHEDSFSIDTPKKDTWRHAEAGAKVVVAAAPKEVCLIKRIESGRFSMALELLSGETLDVIVVEGNPPMDMPKILACRTQIEAETILNDLKDIFCITSLSPENFRPDFQLQVFHPLEDSGRFLDLVESKVFG
jgi:molybdopterin-guanine dinucleotide biosynthesis protein MobB